MGSAFWLPCSYVPAQRWRKAVSWWPRSTAIEVIVSTSLLKYARFCMMEYFVLMSTIRNLGVDPARGHVKELFIRVRHWDGNVEEFRFPEYAHVNLEFDPDAGYDWHDRELHIMRAYYGGEGVL